MNPAAMMQFTVNGRRRDVTTDPDGPLLEMPIRLPGSGEARDA